MRLAMIRGRSLRKTGQLTHNRQAQEIGIKVQGLENNDRNKRRNTKSNGSKNNEPNAAVNARCKRRAVGVGCGVLTRTGFYMQEERIVLHRVFNFKKRTYTSHGVIQPHGQNLPRPSGAKKAWHHYPLKNNY